MTGFAKRLTSDTIVIPAILLNSVALLVLASEPASDRTDSVWFLIDYACVLYFLLEAALKIRMDGWKTYWALAWNRFDLAIVVLSMPMLLAPVIDLHEFGAILILRLGRLFRLFRLLRFIPDGARLARGIGRALKASVGVFLALLIVNIVMAVGASMLFGEVDPQNFGNPLNAMYNMFRVFTVEGWNDLPDRLAEISYPPAWIHAARAYFVIAVLVGGLLGLSLANAVFVDEMTMDNNREIELRVEELAQEIRSLRSELRSDLQRRPEPDPPFPR